jgi:two-component system alkaline phosphatase synthesis response regulator PhoP
MKESLSILLVEDEINLGETLCDYLNTKGHKVELAKTRAEAQKLFSDKFHVILMDINLPDGDGLTLAKEFRQINQNFVLLFLSAQNDPETKYQGLELGAEDYITKPFDLRELNLRLNRILQSSQRYELMKSEIKLGNLKIMFSRFQVMNGDGQLINLSQKECSILELLYNNKDEVVSRDDIINQIWGEDSFPSNRTVDNYIVKLRKWLESDSEGFAQIKSVRGVGYTLTTKE